MKRLVLALGATVAVGSIATRANAQAWLGSPTSAGVGIRTGDFEIHPSLGVEFGYDSNYFSRGNSSNLPIVDTAFFRAVPSIGISTLTGARNAMGEPKELPKVAMSANASLTYTQFLTNSTEIGRSNDVGVNGDVYLGIAPGRPWGFNLFDVVSRTTQPALDSGSSPGLNRVDNVARGEIVYTRPGGMLDWRLGYSLGYTAFEDTNYTNLDNIRHDFYTRGRWRFLPRTAVFYDGSFGIYQYTNANLRLQNSTPVNTRAGINGLVTDRFSFLGAIGWSSTFYDAAPAANINNSFDSLTAQAELRYFLNGAAADANSIQSALSAVFVGYTRSVSSSYLSNYNQNDRGYAGITALFAQRFTLNLQGAVSRIGYGAILSSDGKTPVAGTATGFADLRVEASAFAEFRVASWIGINASGSFINESSSIAPFSGTTTTTGTTPLIDLNYHRFQALLGVRAFY
jgi:hypothetical protein